jgi:hypothetical protein
MIHDHMHLKSTFRDASGPGIRIDTPAIVRSALASTAPKPAR